MEAWQDVPALCHYCLCWEKAHGLMLIKHVRHIVFCFIRSTKNIKHNREKLSPLHTHTQFNMHEDDHGEENENNR